MHKFWKSSWPVSDLSYCQPYFTQGWNSSILIGFFKSRPLSGSKFELSVNCGWKQKLASKRFKVGKLVVWTHFGEHKHRKLLLTIVVYGIRGCCHKGEGTDSSKKKTWVEGSIPIQELARFYFSHKISMKYVSLKLLVAISEKFLATSRIKSENKFGEQIWRINFGNPENRSRGSWVRSANTASVLCRPPSIGLIN